jgi:hypothetical protein
MTQRLLIGQNNDSKKKPLLQQPSFKWNIKYSFDTFLIRRIITDERINLHCGLRYISRTIDEVLRIAVVR